LVNLELVQLACSPVEQLERVDIVAVKKLYHTVTNITVTVTALHINNVGLPYEILCLWTEAIITQATTKHASARVLTENT